MPLAETDWLIVYFNVIATSIYCSFFIANVYMCL